MSSLLTELNDFDLLAVEGPDSAKFLQGQLTCNLERISAQQSLPGAYCNIKGRVIADFRLFMVDDVYYLQTAAGNGDILKRTLDKYIVFSKASTRLVTDFQRFGLLGSQAQTTLASFFPQVPTKDGEVARSADLIAIRLEAPEPRFLIYRAAGASSPQPFPMPVQAAADAWQRSDVAAGIVHVLPHMQEQYTPQALDYDLLGLVDFRKGCYTGQEIVARMHYRGTAKKRLQRLVCPSCPDVPLVAVVTHEGAESEAEIVASAPGATGGQELLAIMPAGVSAETEVRIRSRLDEAAPPVEATLVPLQRPSGEQDSGAANSAPGNQE